MSPRSSTTTSEPANRQNKPLGLELEEERRSDPSFDETFTDDEARTSGVPSCDEDGICVSKKPRNTSEHVSERLERRGKRTHPGRFQRIQMSRAAKRLHQTSHMTTMECTRGVRDEREVEI